MVIYGIFFLLIVLIIGVGIKYCKYLNDKSFNTFIELNNNIAVITTDKEIVNINKAGLNFFHFDSITAFKKKHKYLSKLFVEVVPEDVKFVQGVDWVTKIDKKQNIKVEMSSGNLRQIFYMQVSKIKTDKYMVSFYNVSRVMAEKKAIMQVAEKDELTKIYNRSKFNTLLARAIRSSLIHDEPFSLIIFDIDHFKRINDTYGHDVGDKVLFQLSSLVKSELRNKDSFARWGGEEFVILSESLTEEEAFHLASRLCQVIEVFAFDLVGHMTCSFGVAQFQTDDSSTGLLKRADRALYQAKESGRNRVCR